MDKQYFILDRYVKAGKFHFFLANIFLIA